MTKRESLNEKSYEGNPHVRFDELEAAAATPRHGSLLYKTRIILSTLVALTVALGANASSITINSVTQRWPWNNKLDITYTITDGQTLTSTGNDVYMRIVFNAKFGEKECVIDGVYDVGASANSGTHTVTWTPPSDFKVKASDCTMTATLYSADNPSGDDYMIIDLGTGKISFEGLLYSQELSNQRYTENTSGKEGQNVYKTDKLVLRKVPHGGPYYTVEKGSPGWTTEYDFYVGIFQVTRGQYNTYIPSKDWSYSRLDGQKGLYKPADKLGYSLLRASVTDPTAAIPALDSLTEKETSFLQILNCKTGNRYGFDLPTLNMSEIANRAGTSTTYSWGDDSSVASQYAQFSSTHGNSTTEVGVLLPNNWGIYDTQGNLGELCLDDNSSGSIADLPNAFTPRWAEGPKRMYRNGNSHGDPLKDSSATGSYDTTDVNWLSFRVYCIMK